MSGEHTAFFYDMRSTWSVSVQGLIDMAPEIFCVCYGESVPHKAIRDLYTFTPAILNNYCRHRIQQAEYPAMVPEDGRSVRGVYATGLTDSNMKKLGSFEGSEYERVKAKVQLLEDDGETAGEVKDTYVYIFLHPEELKRREWDFE